ncbi:hypothetical protein LW135_06570 [Helicobacter sp. faydin-H20]|uniref:LexA family transcriptional regulator n=1 Tax=Helicobacter anatolicus TaxID=2905874 RepID=UPI001E60D2A6|nr:LexA family transcriptional regulator [Helicobacter anatolicus]MCE3037483.1 hypothetical protein [Helicobacter anatolicus]
MEKNFKELVEEMKDFFGVSSIEKVAERLGKSRATGTTWRGRKAIPSDVVLDYYRLRSQSGIEINHQSITANVNNIINIPIYDVNASAGEGYINSEEVTQVVSIDKSSLKKMFGITIFNNLSIITATGDSMTPTIPENAKVLIQKCEVREGQVCVCRVGEELYIKRLQKLPRLRLLSDNKSYEPIELQDREYEIIGVVAGYFKEF